MSMRIFIIAASIAAASCNQKQEVAQQATPAAEVPADTVKKSIPKETLATIGSANFSIKYHAPAVRGRTIWGGLVPYGDVWVTGAHKATAIEFNKDITIAGTQIPRGKYAIFTIPSQSAWTFILNKNWDQHLADEYDAKDDILRTQIPVSIDQPMQERLAYRLSANGESSGSIVVRWEKLKLEVPFQVPQ